MKRTSPPCGTASTIDAGRVDQSRLQRRARARPLGGATMKRQSARALAQGGRRALRQQPALAA